MNKKFQVETILKAQQNDKAARDLVCRQGAGLVHKIAHKVSRAYGQDQRDLAQAGFLVLLQGVDKFDENRGVMPSTFIIFWIKAEVLKQARHGASLVKGPQSNGAQKAHYHLRRTAAKLQALTGQAPDSVDMAKALNLPVHVVEAQRLVMQPVASLSAASPDGASLGDTLADEGPTPEQSAVQAQARSWTVEIMKTFRLDLSEKETAIFDARIASSDPIPGRVLGDQLGMTRQGVSQYEIKIRAKLEKRIKNVLK